MMTFIIPPCEPETVELSDVHIKRLREIANGDNYYWTHGDDGDTLDEIYRMGLVSYGQDEIYHLTAKGKRLMTVLPKA